MTTESPKITSCVPSASISIASRNLMREIRRLVQDADPQHAQNLLDQLYMQGFNAGETIALSNQED